MREKAESEKALGEEELEIRRKQEELEEKKLASYLDQQKSMMGANVPPTAATISDPHCCC